MNVKDRLLFLLILLALLPFLSCTRTVYVSEEAVVQDGKYDTAFPRFEIDAPFNRGFSGGAVFAVRDGTPHFELVGLAARSASTTAYRLIPPKDAMPDDYDLRVPYDGEIFVEQHREIRYGITICVPINAIRDFARDHAARLAAQGYRLRLFE